MPKNSRNKGKSKGKRSKNVTKRVAKNRSINSIKNEKSNQNPIKNYETGVKKETTKENKNAKGKKVKKKHPKLALALKIFVAIFILCLVIGAGVFVGIFFGLFGDDFEITEKELKIGISNSVIVDKNGAFVANLSGDEKRKVITLEEMAEYLPKAYVAIEDERFYKHNGVDIKRTTGAIIKKIFGNGSYGGSTITQQLVKNITKDDETQGLAGITRKVREWAKAFQVERMISKNQILELYLNILYVGGEGNLHGVELGAEYYFNKSAKELNLAECAFLAGINTSPNYYNPYMLYSKNDTEEKRNERIKKKILTVLGKMKELGYIEKQEDYDEAVKQANEGLKFEKAVTTTNNNNSYHTDAVIEQVISQVMEEKKISRQLAENYVYSSGLTIHSTVDSNIQNRIDQEYAKEKYILKGREKNPDGTLKNEHSQSAMAVIDYKTGQVVGIAGGLGEKKAQGWNRATQMKKQTGSTIKIIADVAPALEEKVITPATLYMDEETLFGKYNPKNDGRKYKRAPMNIREFIKLSRNIPAVKIMKELTPKKAIEYLEKLGFSSIDKKADEVPSLAIGGMTYGASPLELAAAYGAIANGGEYITPTFYSKVTDEKGNVILEPKQEKRRVFSEQTAYLTQEIAKEPTKSGGTAYYCGISGIDTAAKTGTTDKSHDRWLCEFTPYYVAAAWFGFDEGEEVRFNGINPAGQIVSSVMKDIHKGLPKAAFQRPSGIVEKVVCRKTGCLATENCRDRYTEIFAVNNIPEWCPGHGKKQKICTETNKIATEFCEEYCEVRDSYYGEILPKEQLHLWTPVNRKSNEIKEVCDVHTKKKEEEKPKEDPKDIPSTKPEGKPGETKPNDSKEPGETKPNTKPSTKPDTKPTTKPDKTDGDKEKPSKEKSKENLTKK